MCGEVTMAHHSWGSPMQRQNGVYEYSLSPYQLKAFKGFFNPGIANLLRRTGRQALFIGPPLIAYYYASVWGDLQWEHNQRKASHQK